MRQAADDLDVVPERLQRLENVGQFVIGVGRLRRPVFHVGAVGNIDEGHPARELRCRPGGVVSPQSCRRQHRFQQRQADDGSQSFQKRPTRYLPGLVHNDLPIVSRNYAAHPANTSRDLGKYVTHHG